MEFWIIIGKLVIEKISFKYPFSKNNIFCLSSKNGKNNLLLGFIPVQKFADMEDFFCLHFEYPKIR